MPSLTEALTAQIMQGMNPQAKVESILVNQHIEFGKQNLMDAQGDTVDKTWARLKKAQEENAPQCIIDAYQRILNKATSAS